MCASIITHTRGGYGWHIALRTRCRERVGKKKLISNGGGYDDDDDDDDGINCVISSPTFDVLQLVLCVIIIIIVNYLE